MKPVVAFVGMSLVALPAHADLELSMSTYVPTVLPLHTDFLEPFARELEAATGGTVEVSPAGTALGNVARQYDQVTDGIVDISFGLHGIPRGRFPCTQVIELPFLTDSATEANEVLWALHDEFLAEEHSAVHVLALMAHDPGVIATTGGHRVERPEDLEGLRIRVPSPFVAAMLEDLGAIPVGMPPGEVYENLQTGALDGVVLPWMGITDFRLTEVTTNAIEIGAYTTPFYFVMNRDSYEGLSDEHRAALDAMSGDALVAQFPGWWDAWGAGGPDEMRANGGEVITPDAELRQVWVDATAPTVARLEARLAEECPNGAALVERARALAAD